MGQGIWLVWNEDCERLGLNLWLSSNCRGAFIYLPYFTCLESISHDTTSEQEVVMPHKAGCRLAHSFPFRFSSRTVYCMKALIVTVSKNMYRREK